MHMHRECLCLEGAKCRCTDNASVRCLSVPIDDACDISTGAHVGTIVKLDIYADFGCPFCYVGTRHLFKAMTAFPEVRFQITWKPYLIDLGVPKVWCWSADRMLLFSALQT